MFERIFAKNFPLSLSHSSLCRIVQGAIVRVKEPDLPNNRIDVIFWYIYGGKHEKRQNESSMRSMVCWPMSLLRSISTWFILRCAMTGVRKAPQEFRKACDRRVEACREAYWPHSFLEGTPIVSELKKINIGSSVDKQLANDHAAEEIAIKGYNEAIALVAGLKDSATRDFLQDILNDEDAHMDNIEALQSEIEQMTLPTFLSTQVEK